MMDTAKRSSLSSKKWCYDTGADSDEFQAYAVDVLTGDDLGSFGKGDPMEMMKSMG